ncbi:MULTISPECIES: FAD-binding monooxygenase [unclassified Streptomyces]|uniref:NAD(P)/FAD-dependent oxidoreductase n=1 Tax=unclassified Streptomyces TaxID=2593676 RepID=UPI002DDC54B9|nr:MULTISPECIES: FAD-binding monooxygenase [unclassified Streptomyces]WSA96360.1 FAD-binding monooxygenase [Streptomyces sp. NBC_01795]WSB80774.1 FAD-binding monooxygenase [Streptomyces sp. NBC_01775]WSS39724.1 FAD-binding monooxygenase [Streptomyces sp. NBC_01187]
MAHAVVLGAGMGGLCAAGSLAQHFERVTVVERDPLPADAAPRRGVPQGRHVHALLGTGDEALERLFPGFGAELVAAGAVRSAVLEQARYVIGGATLARGSTGVHALQATRPLLEAGVRRRVRALSGVKFLEGHDVLGPVIEAGRVTGVRVHKRPGGDERAPDGAAGTGPESPENPESPGTEPEVLSAALVVDALGRAGRMAGWLERAGYGAPPEDRTKIDVGYTTRFLRLPPGALEGDRTVLTGNIPAHPTRGSGLLHQEGDRWTLTLAGMGGDHPPTDEEGFWAFARTVYPTDVYDTVRGARMLSEPVAYRFPVSVRRRFERLTRLPDGLLAIGDSVCSFNPVYGQGMTVAAREAEVLDQCLRQGTEGLPKRYFTEAAKVVKPAWELARSADLAVPQIPGRRPLAGRLVGRYMDRLLDAAHHDPVLSAGYLRVIGMLDPAAALFAPGVAWRVLRGGRFG